MNETEWQVPRFETVELRAKRSDYCICIPVLNEDGRIKAQLERMRPFSEAVDIIMADGGSTDGSMDQDFLRSQNVRTLLTLREPGRQGTQLRMAFAYALAQGYEGILQVDGNNKDGVEAIPQFIDALRDGFEYVQGSRFIRGGEEINTPFIRHVAVRLLASPIISVGAGRWYTDVTNGFRGYSRNYLSHPGVQPFRDVFVKYELILYLTVRANQLGLTSKEIPVRRAYPSGKIPTKISFFSGNSNLLATIVKAALGFYNPRQKNAKR
ncbi:MAG TPA: glycosyltransferase family 2 protein [Candidatus Methylomirabilis sp.]|nr:glycosyltransferase family 2 protein [Candidatus Methylomirabilis sp.]